VTIHLPARKLAAAAGTAVAASTGRLVQLFGSRLDEHLSPEQLLNKACLITTAQIQIHNMREINVLSFVICFLEERNTSM
jgi:hypothetical protein